MKIKVCGIADLEFIEQADSMDIDFIGFIFYTHSKRYLMTGLYNNQIKAISSHIKKVGVFVNETKEQIEKTATAYKLDFVQLHGDEDNDYTAELSKKYPIIKAFRINEEFDFDNTIPFEKYCQYFLFDTRGKLYGGTGEKFNWRLLEQYKGNTPFLLSGGISPIDYKEILKFKHSQFAGVDLNSGFETKPGIKDTKLLQNFINQIR